jgi:hypothetical protein|tara:strand:+ start:923 stop:1273 length:351 start_codon:yes stop_codon:yes gene_type:complete
MRKQYSKKNAIAQLQEANKLAIKPNFDMPKIAEEIITLKFKSTTTFNQALKMFYKIMRRHGIKRGIRSRDDNGTIMSNFEWTICKELFISQVQSYFIWQSVLGETPKDLDHYKNER